MKNNSFQEWDEDMDMQERIRLISASINQIKKTTPDLLHRISQQIDPSHESKPVHVQGEIACQENYETPQQPKNILSPPMAPAPLHIKMKDMESPRQHKSHKAKSINLAESPQQNNGSKSESRPLAQQNLLGFVIKRAAQSVLPNQVQKKVKTQSSTAGKQVCMLPSELDQQRASSQSRSIDENRSKANPDVNNNNNDNLTVGQNANNSRLNDQISPPLAMNAVHSVSNNFETQRDIFSTASTSQLYKKKYEQLLVKLQAKQLECSQAQKLVQAASTRYSEQLSRFSQQRSLLTENIVRLKTELNYARNFNVQTVSSSYALIDTYTRQTDKKIDGLRNRANDIRAKRQKKNSKRNSKSKDVASDDASNTILDNEKDRMQYMGDFAKRFDLQSNNLEKERQKQKLVYQTKIQQLKSILQSRLASSIISRYTQEDKTLEANDVLFNRYLFDEFLEVTPREQYYRLLDIETMDNVQAKLVKQTQHRSFQEEQQMKEYFQELEGKHQQIQDYEHVLVAKNVSVHHLGDSILYVREDCDGMLLRKAINLSQGLPQQFVRYVLKRIGLAVLHLKHRTLQEQAVTSDSVLLTQNEVKLAQYGYTPTLQNEWYHARVLSSEHVQYYPPQYIRHKSTQKLTVWGIGVLFYEAIYCKKPFQYLVGQLKEFEFHEQLVFPQKPQLSDSAKDTIKQCLTRQSNRIQLQQLIRGEYFTIK